ncbi:hypothetical protein RBSH_00790 [Rhodopirellula baltica SH28]|uniref:Uncharacterized protein n=1 Tax=Rhodopirellula baltica SH28 TaxID=993517 RepID=K5DMD7_RHOBT|nr:hypothetical protein RBSH_00790 [Rhodopirellula baltica SH28]
MATPVCPTQSATSDAIEKDRERRRAFPRQPLAKKSRSNKLSVANAFIDSGVTTDRRTELSA